MGSRARRSERMSRGLCLHRLWGYGWRRVGDPMREGLTKRLGGKPPSFRTPQYLSRASRALRSLVPATFFGLGRKTSGASFFGQAGNAKPRPHEKDGVHMKSTIWVLDPTFPTVDGLVGSLRKKTPWEEQLFCALADKHVWAAMLRGRDASVATDRSIGP
jgi:hypothetical protein